MKLTRPQMEMLKQAGHKPHYARDLYSVWEIGRLNTALSLQRLGLIVLRGDPRFVDKHCYIEITDAGRELLKLSVK